MKKYEELFCKKINLVFNGTTINSCWINGMIPTDEESADGRGKLFRCPVDWENKGLGHDYPELLFEAQTLDDLLEKNIAVCPFMPSMFYEVELKNKKK